MFLSKKKIISANMCHLVIEQRAACPLKFEVTVKFGKRKPPEAWMEFSTSCSTTVPQVTFPAESWRTQMQIGGCHLSGSHFPPQFNSVLLAVHCPCWWEFNAVRFDNSKEGTIISWYIITVDPVLAVVLVKVCQGPTSGNKMLNCQHLLEDPQIGLLGLYANYFTIQDMHVTILIFTLLGC